MYPTMEKSTVHMKKYIIVLVFISILLSVNPLKGQGFTELKDGEDMSINGMVVSYSVVKKQTKKGSDLYRLTATITSRDNDHLQIFNTAQDYIVNDTKNAIVFFQFTNATGKAFSDTKAYFYPNPIYINVNYKCPKCPPLKKDEDPDNYNSKSVIIGTQFPSGSTLSNVYNIRVPEGDKPTVRVMVY